MTFSMKQFMIALKIYKDGIIFGALTGAIMAYYVSTKGIGLSELATAGKGLLDSALGRSASLTQIALYKLYGSFILIGSTIGFFLEMLLDRFNIGRGK